MGRNTVVRRIAAWVLAVLCAVAILPVYDWGGSANASEDEWEKTVDFLGTTGIKAPTAPDYWDKDWAGSFIWFGHYNKSPIKFRVLDPQTTKFGGNTVFLDCASVLYRSEFKSNVRPYTEGVYVNSWQNSEIRQSLNSTGFLYHDYGFTDQERDVIAESTVASHKLTTNATWGEQDERRIAAETMKNYVALKGDKVFLLDAEDVVNPVYGYYGGDISYLYNEEIACRDKWNGVNSVDSAWWLRSASTETDWMAGIILNGNRLWSYMVDYSYGVSPAMNLDLNKVLFSSAVKGEAGKTGTEYKLTIIDDSKSINVTSGKKITTDNYKTVTVPYTLGGNSYAYSRISLLVLDKEYTPGNTNNAGIVSYTKLNTSGSNPAQEGTVTFELPSMIKLHPEYWGTEYYLYLVAENVNGQHVTDYSSAPLLIEDPSAAKVLSFDLNSGVSGAPSAISAAAGTSVTIPKSSPVRNGYYFMGWSASMTATSATYKSGDKITMNASLKLYAVWKAATYKLAFDGNGATGGSAPASISVTGGGTATVPKCTLTRTGYYFMGWSTSNTATTATYKSGSQITLTGNLTLFAVWKSASPVTYTLSFDRNGGSGNAPAKITAASGSTVTVPKCSITREGYYFMGWSTSRGGAVAYKSGDTLKLTKDTVLYAAWKAKTVTLSFDRNGGSGNAPAKVTTTYGSTVTIEKCTVNRDGYWFLGWSTVRNGEVKYKSGNAITLKDNTVLYAVWKKK